MNPLTNASANANVLSSANLSPSRAEQVLASVMQGIQHGEGVSPALHLSPTEHWQQIRANVLLWDMDEQLAAMGAYLDSVQLPRDVHDRISNMHVELAIALAEHVYHEAFLDGKALAGCPNKEIAVHPTAQ